MHVPEGTVWDILGIKRGFGCCFPSWTCLDAGKHRCARYPPGGIRRPVIDEIRQDLKSDILPGHGALQVVESLPYNEKVDVYAFGLLLWEMLEDRRVFDGMGVTDFYERVVNAGARPNLDPAWPQVMSGTVVWSSDTVHQAKAPSEESLSGGCVGWELALALSAAQGVDAPCFRAATRLEGPRKMLRLDFPEMGKFRGSR